MDWMISPESRPHGFTRKKLVTFGAYWSSRCFLTQSLIPAFPWALVLTTKLLSPGNSITLLPTTSSLLSLSKVFARTWEFSGRARLFSNVTASPSPPGENIFTVMLTDTRRRKPPSFWLTQPEHVWTVGKQRKNVNMPKTRMKKMGTHQQVWNSTSTSSVLDWPKHLPWKKNRLFEVRGWKSSGWTPPPSGGWQGRAHFRMEA